jgi:hypothetical protein
MEVAAEEFWAPCPRMIITFAAIFYHKNTYSILLTGHSNDELPFINRKKYITIF